MINNGTCTEQHIDAMQKSTIASLTTKFYLLGFRNPCKKLSCYQYNQMHTYPRPVIMLYAYHRFTHDECKLKQCVVFLMTKIIIDQFQYLVYPIINTNVGSAIIIWRPPSYIGLAMAYAYSRTSKQRKLWEQYKFSYFVPYRAVILFVISTRIFNKLHH